VTDGMELAIELYAHVYSYNYVWEAAVREELSCECDLRNTKPVTKDIHVVAMCSYFYYRVS